MGNKKSKKYSLCKKSIAAIVLSLVFVLNIFTPVLATENVNEIEEKHVKLNGYSLQQDYGNIVESEPNNTFQEANPISVDTTVYGGFDETDDSDVFTFDLSRDENLNIVLNNNDGIGMNWLLYKDPNLQEHVAYPTNTDNGKLSGTYKATTGKYYLYVYRHGNVKTGNYSFTISTGDTGTPTNPNPDKKYTMAELSQLNYYDLVDVLASIKWSDITDLFQYNNGAQTFYGDKERIRFIINEVYNRGGQYTSTDTKGISTMLEVIRAGFYLGFYHNELAYLNDRQFHDECLYAIKSVQNNANFKLGTNAQDEIVSSIGLLIWNGSCDAEVVSKSTSVLEQYMQNYNSYITQHSKGTAIYNIMRGIEYDITMYTYYENRLQPEQTQWYGKMDRFVDVIGEIALIGNVDANNKWLINNGIYCVSSLGKFHSNNKRGLQVLTDAMKKYPYVSEQYLYAADAISRDYNGVDYDGNTVDINKIKEDAKQKYLPNIYKFDNQKVIIRTGDKVTVDRVKRLYWASKEVAAQYFRSIDSDKALEPGNADDTLTMIIYNDPDEYSINNILYGLDTNNGGIYIESMGTFFTYERTPEQSIYSLEELFRHEFTHYLQGRYVVPGLWGESEIYKNDRLTWYEEGGAEFFAGSTRTSGVLPRKTIIGNVVGTDPADRYDLYRTLSATYSSGFEFYNYACIAMDFFNNKNFNIYDTLTKYIKNNDVRSYDAYINTLKSDQNLNQQYQNHMQQLINQYDRLTVPLVSDDYLVSHPSRSQSQIYNDIVEVSNLKNAKIETKNSQFFNTFIIRGTYTGGASQGKVKDIENMNKIANDFLNKLDNYNWSGYKTVTSYFVDYRLDKNNNVVFDVVFHGLLP